MTLPPASPTRNYPPYPASNVDLPPPGIDSVLRALPFCARGLRSLAHGTDRYISSHKVAHEDRASAGEFTVNAPDFLKVEDDGNGGKLGDKTGEAISIID